jgi:hypothetical protein
VSNHGGRQAHGLHLPFRFDVFDFLSAACVSTDPARRLAAGGDLGLRRTDDASLASFADDISFFAMEDLRTTPDEVYSGSGA